VLTAGVAACFSRQAFIRSSFAATPAPLNPNKAFAYAHDFFVRGQPPLSICARLRVARANRAVTFFAMFRSVFLSTLFSGLCRVSFRSFRKLHFLHSHRKTLFNPSKSAAFQSFIHSASYIPSLLQVGSLALPEKKLHCTAKNAPALRVPRRQPQPSFRFAPLRAIQRLPPSLHSQSARALCSGQKMHFAIATPHF
jgi:hypothetical protein